MTSYDVYINQARALKLPVSDDLRSWFAQVADYCAIPWRTNTARPTHPSAPHAAFRIVYGPGSGYAELHVAFDSAGNWLSAWVEGAPIGGITARPGEHTALSAAHMATQMTTATRQGAWCHWHAALPKSPGAQTPSWVQKALARDIERQQREANLHQQAMAAASKAAAHVRENRARTEALEALAKAHPEEFDSLLEMHRVMEGLRG